METVTAELVELNDGTLTAHDAYAAKRFVAMNLDYSNEVIDYSHPEANIFKEMEKMTAYPTTSHFGTQWQVMGTQEQKNRLLHY